MIRVDRGKEKSGQVSVVIIGWRRKKRLQWMKEREKKKSISWRMATMKYTREKHAHTINWKQRKLRSKHWEKKSHTRLNEKRQRRRELWPAERRRKAKGSGREAEGERLRRSRSKVMMMNEHWKMVKATNEERFSGWQQQQQIQTAVANLKKVTDEREEKLDKRTQNVRKLSPVVEKKVTHARSNQCLV